MTVVFFLLSLIPAIAWILYFYFQDRYEKEPFRLILWSFLLGCFSVIPAIIAEMVFEEVLNFYLPFSPFRILSVMLMVGFTEEYCKFLGVKFGTYRNPEFNEPMDGIVYSVSVAMGFAFVENIGYMMNSHSESGVVGAVSLGVMRALFSMFGHASFGVILGYYLGRAKFCPEREKELTVRGIIFAGVVHALYNFTLQMHQGFLAAILVLPAFIMIWKNMNRVTIDAAEMDSPFRPPDDQFIPIRWKWKAANTISVLAILSVIAFSILNFNKPVEYANVKGRFVIFHPPHWQRGFSSDKRQIEITGPSFRRNVPKVKLQIFPISDKWSRETEMDSIVKALAAEYKGFRRVGSGKVLIDGGMADYITVGWIKDDKRDGAVQMLSMVAIKEKGRRMVRFVCSSRESQFSSQESSFRKMLESFRFSE